MNVPFEITSGPGQSYLMRNVSDQTVDLVTVTVDHPEGLTRDLPSEDTFGPGASKKFLVLATWQTGRPVEVLVSWDVHPTPYALPLPPKN
ncbi:hypothetical protein I6I18_04640 [Kytococcus sedentarius]|uniref:Uncharacterized protein n=2 Tax=Micrococcales TaxID=85006 RepID=A0A0L6CHQ1_9MICO|nr:MULTISPECIES: hypothetical protein [Micrococcales]ACV06398.1 hypothetical protein Ksed_13700 [Kytococcus sedentarius DSM 20547]KNX37043.1 hypothetical protein VV01_07605 [Luteipulveratus halotolerans]QQB64722.1 hypothetical protein I6I18_04640 [Kytococcus sedentarius]STX12181.1 Uncharacterised protein [Kytococcus sedentarius]